MSNMVTINGKKYDTDTWTEEQKTNYREIQFAQNILAQREYELALLKENFQVKVKSLLDSLDEQENAKT